jgi:ornithine--oxo-acid transaminase/putrescine aminotransferase
VVSPLVCRRLYRRGFFCFTCGHDWTIFRLQPRFDIPRATLDAFVDVASEALSYVEGLT